MKKTRTKKHLITLIGLWICVGCFAGDTYSKPLQLALWNPSQLVPEDADIRGLRLSLIYGKNHNMTGVDLGVFNKTTGDFNGIAAALLGNESSTMKGIQIAGWGNLAEDMSGIQAALGGNGARQTKGIQLGFLVNYASDSVTGIQFGLFNNLNFSTNAIPDVRGIQTGWPIFLCVNIADTLTGVQAGLINGCEEMNILQMGGFNVTGRAKGIQFGGLNICKSMRGLQIGLLWNNCLGIVDKDDPSWEPTSIQTVRGIQVAMFNKCRTMRGIQMGVVNWCDELKGVQIGVANIITEGPIKFFPILNASF